MASVFTRIIDGEIPGTFVWRDERCVGLMSINPLCPGHVLVIPREEVAHWVDLDPELLAHLTAVSQSIARAIDHAYEPERVGAMYAGLEVAHVHHHLVPIEERPGLCQPVRHLARGARGRGVQDPRRARRARPGRGARHRRRRLPGLSWTLAPPSMHPGVVLHEQYELRGQLGQGGMGSVWLAYDTSLARESPSRS